MDSMYDGGIKWGAEIAVDGVRPEWLCDGDYVRVWNAGKSRRGMNGDVGEYLWSEIQSIVLPADHPHYQKQAAPKVDWSKPIEAVHVDGRVQPAKVEDWDGDGDETVGVRFEDGEYAHLHSCTQNPVGFHSAKQWTIRNVQTPEAATPAIDPTGEE